MSTPAHRLLLLLFLVTIAAADPTLYEPIRFVARPDYELGYVFIERWRGNQYIGVERVVTISDYLDYELRRSVSETWRQKVERTQERREIEADASGLIPDIVLPKLPLFGEGSRIDISGRDRITLGGRQTFVRGAYLSSGSLFPELKMEQQLSVLLNGTIGERTKVTIDYDVERRSSDNKVLLAYTGTEDEIVQTVELGNTRLSIPATAYTGDLPARKGLFGASARGRLGGIDIYAVASREESQGQTQTFTGRRIVNTDTIYCGQYLPRRFYVLPVPETTTVRSVRVYIDDKNQSNNQTSEPGIATVWPDQPDRLPDSTNWTYDRAPGAFDPRIANKDYIIHPGNIIEFTTTIDNNNVIGLIIETATDTIGGSYYQDSLVLLLLKPERTDTSSLTWDNEMRNIYSLRRNDVSLQSFRLYRDSTGSVDLEYEDQGPNAGRRFSEILGIDPDGDGRIDYPWFEAKTGLIRFPGRKPFQDPGLSVRESIIYRKEPSQLRPDEGRKYFIVATYTSTTEKYYLGQPDITENSERVMVNGEVWRRGDDYTIDYRAGTINFVRPLLPDANIQVTYEYQPIFSISQKSLVGTRAEWNPAPATRVGTSLFFRGEGTADERPQLGTEPFNRAIAEADAAYAWTSDAVTAFIDRLPVIRASNPTRFDAAGEVALSLPDPNTRGTAWLDDFSGTTLTSDVSITSGLWSWASVPVEKDTADFATRPIFWRNARRGQQVPIDSVFGPQTGRSGETHDYLRVIYQPDSNNPNSWAGIMTGISGGSNLSDFENLQIVLRSRRRSGRIHITVGYSIDEDAPRRNRAGRIVGYDGINNTEDRNGNGILDADEDTGLDGIFGDDSKWNPDSADDGNDDFDEEINPNGTEGNRRTTPDAEDLDRSGFSRYNHYFECAINLDDARWLQPLHRDWQLLRVPLKDSTIFRATGRPRWEDVRLVRIWFDNFIATDTIDFYSIEFTGSRWASPRLTTLTGQPVRPPKRDTLTPIWHHNTASDTVDRVWVRMISRTTDPGIYTSPYELRKDAQGRLEEEAALLLGYQRLRADRRAVITRVAADRDDYRDYRELRIYVHDDGNSLSFLLRLGSDSLNYYEYRAPITAGRLVPGRDDRWYEFAIPLDSLPILKVLKAQRDSQTTPTDTFSRGQYRLRGNPTLADIRYTALGIENETNDLISGAIWFNDMRLSGPRRETGYGAQARAALSLADFVTASANVNYSDPNFRRFSEGREVKIGGFGTQLAASIRTNFDRLLPYSWGLSIPLLYQVSRQENLPKYSTDYSDLRTAGTIDSLERSFGRTEEFAIENVRKQRSGSRLLNYTVEALTFSGRRRKATNQGPLGTDTSTSTTTQLAYAIAPAWRIGVWGDEELSLLPQNIRLAAVQTQRRDFRRTFRPRLDSTLVRAAVLSTDASIDYSPFDELDFGLDFQSERDLLPDSARPWYQRVGTEASQDQSFDAGYEIELGDVLTPSIDFSSSYSHDRLKAGNQYLSVRNMNNSGDVDLSLGLDIPEILERLGAEPTPSRTRAAAETSSVPSRAAPKTGTALRQRLGRIARYIEPVDIAYSYSRGSDLVAVSGDAPIAYRFGIVNYFTTSESAPPTSITRDQDNTLRASSGLRFGEVSSRVAFDATGGRQYRIISRNQSAVLDSTVTWPDLTLNIGKVHNLFKELATSSTLSSRFALRRVLSGELRRDTLDREYLAVYGRTETNRVEFSPLLSWQTSWKRRVTTTLSANYTMARATSFRNETGTNKGESDTRTRGAELSLAYSFAAPQGIKLPFLSKVRFSSDLSLTWSLRYSNSLRRDRLITDQNQNPNWTGLQNDNSVATTLSASYRFSRSIEAGLQTGYSRAKGLAPQTTETLDLNVWVMFRF